MEEDKKYGQEKKKIVFVETDKRCAELMVRLHYDGIKRYVFFRELITEYLANNDLMIMLVDEIKKKIEQSKTKRRIVKKHHEAAKDTIKKFGLDEDEIENIFDLLEEEFPDL